VNVADREWRAFECAIHAAGADELHGVATIR